MQIATIDIKKIYINEHSSVTHTVMRLRMWIPKNHMASRTAVNVPVSCFGILKTLTHEHPQECEDGDVPF